MLLFWIGLLVTMLPGCVVVVGLTGMFFYLIYKYGGFFERIFQEKPLFIVPRGQPVEGAEDVSLGHTQRSASLWAAIFLPRVNGRRRGVILFGLEFGSNRWSCLSYCDYLLANGYDIFTFESRSQGDSEAEPGYEPLQWVTDFEVEDTRAALAYLKSRPDADPKGLGFFGISKGAGAGLLAAVRDPRRYALLRHRWRLRHLHATRYCAVHAPVVSHLQSTYRLHVLFPVVVLRLGRQ